MSGEKFLRRSRVVSSSTFFEAGCSPFGTGAAEFSVTEPTAGGPAAALAALCLNGLGSFVALELKLAGVLEHFHRRPIDSEGRSLAFLRLAS